MNKHELLSRRPKVESFEAPEWGTVYLRPMTVNQLLVFEARRESISALELYPLVVSLSMCDEAGNLVFEESDFEALKGVSFEILQAVGSEALKVSRLGQGSDEALAKNS